MTVDLWNAQYPFTSHVCSAVVLSEMQETGKEISCCFYTQSTMQQIKTSLTVSKLVFYAQSTGQA